MQVEFTDRYDALGISRPRHLTMCRGGCEGTGIDFGADDAVCTACAGSGRAPGRFVAVRRLPRQVGRNVRFLWQHGFHRDTWRMDVKHPVRFNFGLVLRIALTTW